MLAILTFVDHSLSLIISFLDSQASFALTTTNTCSLKLHALYSWATPWGWPDGLEHTHCRSIARLECMTPVSIEQLRATLGPKSIKVKSSQRQNWTADSNIMVQTVVTSKHEDCNLVFTNHGKEDGIHPQKRDSKSTRQRSKIYCNNMQKHL